MCKFYCCCCCDAVG